MPSRANCHINYNRTRSLSIRDELEKRAWTQNPGLARRLSSRRQARETDEHRGQTSGDAAGDTSARRIMRWQDRILLALAVLLLLLIAIRGETAAANDQPWGLQLLTNGETFTEMAIDTEVQLDITGLLARVSVTQRFSNSSSEWAEGVYRFPLPQGAAVDRLRVVVGSRILEGEIQEKMDARRTYTKARNSGRTATLVEQQRRNQFETKLANIAPGEAIEVTIGYLHNVSYSDFSYSLRLPMTFTPRWEPPIKAITEQVTQQPSPKLIHSSTTDDHRLKLQARLVSAVEFAAIESRYHDVDIRRIENGYRIELLKADDVSDRDFELSWTPALQTRPSTSLTTFNDGGSVYAQLMLAPPLAASIEPLPREVVLVIDTSGSMEGASITQARAALVHALGSLGPDDYFNLLQFNSDAEQLFEQSIPAASTGLYVARNFISSLEANGGTNMRAALKAALALPQIPHLMRQVVFITDGAVGNEADLLQFVAEKLGPGRMFTVAIGHAPNSWFMRKAAEIGRGSYVHIAKSDEVEQRMSALWGRIQLPALTDISVDWGTGAEYYPEVIPDLYAGEPLWLTARLPSQPTIISLSGNLNGELWNLDINGWDAALGNDGGDNLAKLWARKKIEALQDSTMFGADRELTKLEITGLALDYGLLTRHTSLVAVDKTPRRPGGEQLARSDIPGLIPAGSTMQLAAYPQTATGWLAQLLLSSLVLLLATGMLVFSGPRSPMTKHAGSP